MKNTENKQERPQGLKRKLMSALAMLLVATILMSTTSYAWFVLSTAPEVTGIETQVGANGSLEIALLNKDTRADMSTIRAGLGGSSLQVGDLSANYAWGNLVDLGFQSYGLGELVLLPARLDVSGSEGSYLVNPGLLAVPSYGYDGRIIELTQDTATAIYQETGFLYSGAQEYGVRAIGTSDALSTQGSALSMAKNNISAYTKDAKNKINTTLTANSDGLMEIVLALMTADNNDAKVFNDENVATLVAMLTDLDAALDFIDLSLRQGLVAYGASQISGEEAFILFRDRVMDTSVELPQVVQDLSELSSVPAEFASWVEELDEMQNTVNDALNQCYALEGGSYSWNEISPILTQTMNIEKVLVNDKSFNDAKKNPAELLGASVITMTLAPGSGLFADIANFVDNYTVTAKAMGKDLEMKTARSSQDGPAYLVALSAAVNTLEPADGGDDATALPLTATYGYALDLAFRCNAAMPDLVLQTKGVQRVYNGGEDPDDIESTNGTGQGGGSYMEFTSVDDAFTLEQRLKLMDAIRVGFVDVTGSLLGIAKLNVTSREVVDGYVRAPLYLYDYELTQDEHGMYLTIGERKLTDNLITPLEQNVAKAVTVIVWLDGDLVDNTMVSATKAASLDGVLNLQFATTAELVPAVEGSVLDYTPDKTGLEEAVAALAETYNAGQGTYTNVSWNAFTNAYNRAVSVNDNLNASQIEIRNAVEKLSEAVMGLQNVDATAVNEKIEEIRQLMGSTDDTSRYVIAGADGYTAVGEASDEEKESWDVKGTITSVDYAGKNKQDEGNGIYTNVYSNESWDNLANALYNAEAVAMNPNATDDQINAALTALENAEKALTRQVFYAPYEYNGDLYYMAICEADAQDTYGRWYDSSFKRIVADVTILNLDAYAVPAVISQVGQEGYVSSDAEYITPDIAFLEEVFPELRDVQVKGVKWDDVDAEIFTELMHQYHYDRLTELMAIANSDAVLQEYETGSLTAAKDAANLYITEWEKGTDGAELTAAAAEGAISDLTAMIVQTYEYALEQSTAVAGATMTANQRILLSSAVNAARGVEGYKDTANTDFNALRTAAGEAEKLLIAATVTGQQAVDALTALNAELTNVGVVAGGLIQTLPEGFQDSDIVYDVQYPGIKLKLTGKSGETTLGAKVLTQDGVVISVSKDITVFDKADGVKITQLGNQISSLDLTVGGSADLTADLFYEAGGVNTGTKPLDEILGEEIKAFKWASSNTAAVEVSDKEAGTATVSATGAGDAIISVSIEAMSGTVYTFELPVIVTE